jgi:excinuclease ABC subunit B
MKSAIDETNRRRAIQEEYNRANNITPRSVSSQIKKLSLTREDDMPESSTKKEDLPSPEEQIELLTAAMKKAAAELNFEKAAELRDKIKELEKEL